MAILVRVLSQCILICLILTTGVSLQSQEIEYMVFFQDTIPTMPPTGEALFIRSKPCIPRETMGNKIPNQSWMNLCYSEQEREKFFSIPPNRFIYTIRRFPSKELHFLYTNRVVEISPEDAQFIKYTNINSLLQTRLTKEKKATLNSKLLGEVQKWTPRNLWIIHYDVGRNKYYRYRVALVVYCDMSNPSAFIGYDH